MWKIKGKIDYKLFKISPRKDTLLGKNNWTYYYDENVLKDFQHTNIPDETELNEWCNNFKELNEYLKSNNIKFTGVILPDKKTVYPENYPDGIIQLDRKSRSEIMVDKFNENGVDFIFPLEDLKNEKNNAVVYSQTFDFTHWNNYGAFVGYQSIIKHLKENYFPNIKLLSKSDFNIVESEYTDIYQNLFYATEKQYSFNPKFTSNTVEDPAFYDSFADLGYIGRPEVIKKRYINEDKTLPKVVYIGDSMSYDYIFPYMKESFSEFTFLHISEMDKARQVIEKANPDIVIYEFVERMFNDNYIYLKEFNDKLKYESDLIPSTVISTNENIHYLDYINRVSPEGNNFKLDKSNKTAKFEGWAIDANAGKLASKVIIQVGNEMFETRYGIERDSVSSYFGKPDWLYSGYEVEIDTNKLLDAGKFYVHIISNDGNYEYTPIEYTVQG